MFCTAESLRSWGEGVQRSIAIGASVKTSMPEARRSNADDPARAAWIDGWTRRRAERLGLRWPIEWPRVVGPHRRLTPDERWTFTTSREIAA